MLFRHVLRNAMLPILTSTVAALPLLFMGSLIAESFFGIPGLGSYTIDAINAQDFSIVRAMVFLGASRGPDPGRRWRAFRVAAMPKIVLLWTDIALWLMALGVLAYAWYVRRSPALRATWGVSRATRRPCVRP